MARAETVTLLSLDRFFAICGVDPLSANQLTSDLLTPLACTTTIYQWNWASPAMAGREEYAQAIKMAENQITKYIGYYPAPTYTVNEQQLTVKPQDPTMVAGMGGWWGRYSGQAINVRGLPKSVTLNHAKFIAGGRKAKTLIQANAPVNYTDEDGDGYDETATILVSTDITDLCEIHIYDPGKGGADSWEIRPATVTAGPLDGQVTVVTRREQCVDPALWEAINAGAVGPIPADVDANFITEVDVYRVYLDPSVPVIFHWQNIGCVYCGGSGCSQCTDTVQEGCLNARDNRLGIVSYAPGTWDAETGSFTPTGYPAWREPDKMQLWYLSGFENEEADCPRNTLSAWWERVIAYLALANLQGDVCQCTAFKTMYDWAQTDLAKNDGNSNISYNVGDAVLKNPFGTLQGAVRAFQMINSNMEVIPR